MDCTEPIRRIEVQRLIQKSKVIIPKQKENVWKINMGMFGIRQSCPMIFMFLDLWLPYIVVTRKSTVNYYGFHP